MKLKDMFLGMCVVALLAGELFLYSANRQKNAALDQVRGAKQQVEQLRNALQQIQTTGSEAQNSEIARLRSENLDLLRLRNEVRRLNENNQQLTQQLQAARNTLQQQQDQLQQFQAQSQPAPPPAPTPVPADQPSPQPVSAEVVQRLACINNLRQIDTAKLQWALENGKSAEAVVTAPELLPYLKDAVFPSCPSGGTYTINPVGQPPTCSVSGHALPP